MGINMKKPIKTCYLIVVRESEQNFGLESRLAMAAMVVSDSYKSKGAVFQRLSQM